MVSKIFVITVFSCSNQGILLLFLLNSINSVD